MAEGHSDAGTSHCGSRLDGGAKGTGVGGGSGSDPALHQAEAAAVLDSLRPLGFHPQAKQCSMPLKEAWSL